MPLHLCAILLVALISVSTSKSGFSQGQRPLGTLKGQLLDAETKLPLIGATVLLTPADRGTTTDLEGQFTFDAIPVGAYTLQFSYVGFAPITRTDVVVRSQRITRVDAELHPAVLETDAVVVTAGYFTEQDQQPVSVVGFGYEEIRRAPGAGGDVSRILSGLPAIANVDDMRNSLVVRGGSPLENSFFIDNIEIPNINHFPTQGSSGGPIGLLNVDFIDEVTFYAGGFSAAYGDRLSSVMDISFREGNRDAYDVQLDLSFAGAGVVGEGPLGSKNGSWLFSARRSYLDFLINTFFEDEAGAALPIYSDYQGKVVYDLSAKHRITLLGVLGMDTSIIERDDALEEQENVYGDWENTSGTFGGNWRYLWGRRGFSNTALSHTFTRYRVGTFKTQSGAEIFDNRSMEQAWRLRNVNYVRINPAHRFEFGIDANVFKNTYDNRYAAYTDPLGQPTPALQVDDETTAARLGGFVSYSWQPMVRLSLTPGLRADHDTFTDRTTVSPRFSASYQLTAKTSFNAAAGVYHQVLPLVLLAQQDANKGLQTPRATHLIVGLQHLLTESTRLSIEAYNKAYRHFPLDPSQPSLFIIDQLYYQANTFLSHERLTDTGRADTRGVEVMIQKKLARKLYGTISGAYFRSRYQDDDGQWRRRVFDNRYLFTVEGGFKPGHKQEFSLKWIYAGGAPYTPFDIAASEALGQGVFDEGRVNGERLPAYHSLNLRYDRRFHFKASTLVAYLSLWNAYGRRNVATYSWNEIENVQQPVEQWGTLPIFGLEYEF